MFRWIAVALTMLLLSGCVTTEYVYRDRYYDSSGYTADGYYDSGQRAGGGSYYSPAYDGRGDYYYRRPTTGYYGYDSYPSWYWDYPYYYSVFWPLYRSWHDPYWYPNYYYGVTYYPSNYLSISYHSGWGWPRYGSFYYSPYRYSWVDNYYDWRPWYGSHYYRNHGYHAPRYGSARNEAERLSRMSDFPRYGTNAYSDRAMNARGYSDTRRETAFGTYGTTRSGARDADYGSRTAPRQDPGTRGFGVPQDDGYRSDVRRNAAYGGSRQAPSAAGFGAGAGDPRGVDYGGTRSRTTPQVSGFGAGTGPMPDETPRTAPRGYERESSYGASREIGRYGNATAPSYSRGARRGVEMEGVISPNAPRYERAPADAGVNLPRRSYEPRSYERPTYAPRTRDYSTEHSAPVREAFNAPMPEPRRFERSYETPAPSYSAPEPRFETREAPRYETHEAPSFETRESPRFESRSESRSNDSDRGDSDVRRVGSNRDD